MNKKGVELLVGALVALIVSIGFIFILAKLGVVDFLFGAKRECSNLGYWNDMQPILQKLDSGSKIKDSINFYNKPCVITTFLRTDPGEIAYPYGLDITVPNLCLCNLDGKACKIKSPEQCFSFKKIKGFGRKQFTTADYDENIFLDFEVKGDQLVIKEYGAKEKAKDVYITNVKSPDSEFKFKSATITSTEKLSNDNVQIILEPSEDTKTFPSSGIREKLTKYKLAVLKDTEPFVDFNKIILYGELTDEFKNGKVKGLLKNGSNQDLEWTVITKDQVNINLKNTFPEGYYSVEFTEVPELFAVTNIK